MKRAVRTSIDAQAKITNLIANVGSSSRRHWGHLRESGVDRGDVVVVEIEVLLCILGMATAYMK